MKKYAEITEVKQQLASITCDCCKVDYYDPYEIQEFLSWEDTCGYGNQTFGDLTIIEIDLCQYCVEALLGKYIRVTEQGL